MDILKNRVVFTIVPKAKDSMETELSKLNMEANFEWRDELEKVLKKHGIEKDEVCLVGSFPMFAAGIREYRDIDIVVNPSVRAQIIKTDKTIALSSCVNVNARDWARLVSSNRVPLVDEDIINNPRCHVIFEGFKVLRLEILFAIKLARGRDKDIRDISIIEQYALTCPSWDWGLLREYVHVAQHEKHGSNTISSLTRIFSLGKRAVANPRGAIRFVISMIPRLLQTNILIKTLMTRPAPHIQSQLITKMPTAALLGNQFINGEFSRYDVLMRYLAIQSIVSGSEDFKSYYVRMQDARAGRETYDSLRELVKNIQKKGFLSRYPIPITKEGHILDGAHRLACALYFGINEAAVTVEPTRRKVYYGRIWFAENGFDNELLNMLDRTKDALFQKHGVWFPVILWPPVEPWFEEITREIGKRFVIKWEDTLDLGNKLPDFARQIYSIDDIDRWKVELKLHMFQTYKPVVKILALEIPEPDFRPKIRTRTYLSDVGADLKRWIRHYYSGKVADYFYDIICHTGDNHEHNRRIFEIIDGLRKNDGRSS